MGRSCVVLDWQTVSWGENVEVPPESDDDEEGTDSSEEGRAGGDDKGSGRNSTVGSNLDALADGFVDDDFLTSDDGEEDDKDERCDNNGKRVKGQTKVISMLRHLEESPPKSAVASKRTAARALDTGAKVRASAPTEFPQTRREASQARIRKKWIGASACHR